MELISVIRTLARWFWLIVIIVGVTTAVILLTQRHAETVYESTITLEITQPDPETVALYDEYNYRSERDKIVIALNKFIEVAQYDITRQRTMDTLDIDEAYALKVDTELGADFVYITATASSPELARKVARTHAQEAIKYFGELRTQPLAQALLYFELEVADALHEIEAAEQALLEFRRANGFISIQDELAIQNNVLNQLEILKWLGNDSASSVLSPGTGFDINDILTATEGLPEDDMLALDQLIVNQRQRLIAIAQLEPEYYALQQDITIAREKYNTLASKFTEAELKASFASHVFFIQVIDDANLPTAPSNNHQEVFFGILGSLGFSVLLVFLLDYIRDGKTRLQLVHDAGNGTQALFVLTDEEVQQLRAAENRTQDASELKRLQALRLYGTGMRAETILDIHQCDPRTFLEWVADFQDERNHAREYQPNN